MVAPPPNSIKIGAISCGIPSVVMQSGKLRELDIGTARRHSAFSQKTRGQTGRFPLPEQVGRRWRVAPAVT